MSGPRTRRLALWLIGVIVLAGTVTAFVQSYEGLYSWARRYLSEGWARTWPLQVDAWIAVGELALYLAYRDRWPRRRRVWPWVAALTGLAASTGFNVGHLADADLAGQLTAAVPPVAAFGGLFLGLQVLKQVELDSGHQRSSSRQEALPLVSALQMAHLLVTADRLAARPATMAAIGNGGQPSKLEEANDVQPHPASSRLTRRGRRTPPAIEAEAARILRVEPDITGADLARRIGIAERTGRRLADRLQGHADIQ